MLPTLSEYQIKPVNSVTVVANYLLKVFKRPSYIFDPVVNSYY